MRQEEIEPPQNFLDWAAQDYDYELEAAPGSYGVCGPLRWIRAAVRKIDREIAEHGEEWRRLNREYSRQLDAQWELDHPEVKADDIAERMRRWREYEGTF